MVWQKEEVGVEVVLGSLLTALVARLEPAEGGAFAAVVVAGVPEAALTAAGIVACTNTGCAISCTAGALRETKPNPKHCYCNRATPGRFQIESVAVRKDTHCLNPAPQCNL